MIRVVIVDDHPIFRSGLVQAVSTDGDITVLGEGSSGAEAVGLVRELKPDVLLLDARMSDDGVDHVGAILLANAPTRIIMVTASEDENDIAGALEAGVSGYVLKGTTGPDMRNIVRSVHGGENYVPQSIIGRLLNVLKEKPGDHGHSDPGAKLSRQEIQVLQLLSQGLNNKEIGDRLGVTERTVKFHMSNIFSKLQVRNRVEASIRARKIWPGMQR
jgi:DNA-binding NarL/FixJ family response regulator